VQSDTYSGQVMALQRLKDPVLRSFVLRLVGDFGVEVVERMPGQETTDERVAEATGIELNKVRRTLYLLYENRLATYRRERDEDSGWLTYLWRLELDNFYDIMLAEVRKLADILERRMEFEENVFYACTSEPPCCRVLFGDAVESEFRCPMCGAPLDYFDGQHIQRRIQTQLNVIREKVR